MGETTGLSLVDTTPSGGLTYAYSGALQGSRRLLRVEPLGLRRGPTTGPCIEPPAFAGAAAVDDATASPAC